MTLTSTAAEPGVLARITLDMSRSVSLSASPSVETDYGFLRGGV